jgi:hypothetical protein
VIKRRTDGEHRGAAEQERVAVRFGIGGNLGGNLGGKR